MKKRSFLILILIISATLRLWMLNAGDVTDDEKHYITEAQRMVNKDPYVALRYHPRNHPEPSIGHPLLYQVSQALIFRFFGITVYTSRLLNAISGIFIVLLLMLFNKQLGGKVSTTAAFLTALLPMAVRYSRNAQLDTFFTVWITLVALLLWKYMGDRKKIWLILSGLSVGLAMSTKLNGIYVLGMAVLLLTFVRKTKITVVFFRKLFFELCFILFPAFIIFFLLNDPMAYIDGIVKPSFESYNFFTKRFFTERIPFLFSLRSIYVFVKANLFILSPGFLTASIFSVFFLFTKVKEMPKRLLILWFLPLLHLFIIHGFGMDGVYGWIPFLPPLMLTISLWLMSFKKNIRILFVFLIIILSLPSLFLYGMSIKPVPFKGYPSNHNRSYKQNFYQNTIEIVNDIAPVRGKVYFLPQNYYPLYALRPDISWSYYGDLKSFDVLVVDKISNIDSVKTNINYYANIQGSQDDQELTRYIFLK